MSYHQLPVSDVEDPSERSLLQAKAKHYGIKANLSTDQLREAVKLYEAGEADKIPKEQIKKGNEGNFLAKHKKAIGISGGSSIVLIIIILIIIFSGGNNTTPVNSTM